jgi:hypothetical protein
VGQRGKFCLEQRGRAALPGRAFFFANVLHVGDVGSGLGQDVVQVVADADQGESLVQEFADTRGAEQLIFWAGVCRRTRDGRMLI